MDTKRFQTRLCAFALAALTLLSGCSSTGSSDTAAETNAGTQSNIPAAELIDSDGSARVWVQDGSFVVGSDAAPIWFSGCNTPWDNWNDFGKDFDYSFWDTHFAQLKESGINASRVWLVCSGDYGIEIDENGMVSGATDEHWASVDCLMELAAKHEIYIMATLMSFDCCKTGNAKHKYWRAMMQSEEAIDTYVENYVIPFCQRYDSNDYLWSIDICNEPDWIIEEERCGQLEWRGLVTLFSSVSAAIHQNSDILVTVGMGMIKYNSDNHRGDYIGDQMMKQFGGDDAVMDFYSVHFYEWQISQWGNAFAQTPAEFGLSSSHPAVLGECPAVGLSTADFTECAKQAYENGWQGVLPWTSNGVDGNGGFEEVSAYGKAMEELIPDLIHPLGAES